MFCCKQKHLREIDPASTLGSRRDFHWVTQGFPLGDPSFWLGDPNTDQPGMIFPRSADGVAYLAWLIANGSLPLFVANGCFALAHG
jgi:hypothetical protein